MKSFRFARSLILIVSSVCLTFPLVAADSTVKKSKATTTESDARRSTKATKVDVNTADLASLETLPGVGPETARAIVAARPFKSVNDLERVPGIGPVKMKELKTLVTASKVSTKKDDAATNARTDSRPSTIPPASPYEPATTPRSTRSENDRSLEPTGRIDSERRAPASQSSTTAQGRINLNTATLQELESLPEIGPVKAQAIIDARPFRSIEDVMRVKGIKEGTFDAIKDKITVR